MARALIVGCGCRGRALGASLLAQGWQVRGTSRRPDGLRSIESAGIEAAPADPDRAGTVLDHVGDVTVVAYLMATIQAEPEGIAAIHGPRLERILERLVDGPVRGFVYEAAGTVKHDHLESGSRILSAAAARWRIPVARIESDPSDHQPWLEEAVAAVSGVTAQGLRL